MLDSSGWTWVNQDEEFGNFDHWAPGFPLGGGECGGLSSYGESNWRWENTACVKILIISYARQIYEFKSKIDTTLWWISFVSGWMLYDSNDVLIFFILIILSVLITNKCMI